MTAPIPGLDLFAARRILVVKLDEIGDFVLAPPFLRGLRTRPRAGGIPALFAAGRAD